LGLAEYVWFSAGISNLFHFFGKENNGLNLLDAFYD
jgi:hypothetical protein